MPTVAGAGSAVSARSSDDRQLAGVIARSTCGIASSGSRAAACPLEVDAAEAAFPRFDRARRRTAAPISRRVTSSDPNGSRVCRARATRRGLLHQDAAAPRAHRARSPRRGAASDRAPPARHAGPRRARASRSKICSSACTSLPAVATVAATRHELRRTARPAARRPAVLAGAERHLEIQESPSATMAAASRA